MNEKFQAFMRVLDPEDNQTGGGAASAVAGAMAAGLVGMVARVSLGKKNMPEPDSYYEAINVQAQTLKEELIAGSNADSKAFDSVMMAIRMPKDTEEDRKTRSAAIQAGYISATEIPLQNAQLCAQVIELADKLNEKSNKNAASDLECAYFLAHAGLKGAVSNLEINIGAIKDQEKVREFEEHARTLRKIIQ